MLLLLMVTSEVREPPLLLLVVLIETALSAQFAPMRLALTPLLLTPATPSLP
jgi:hypothetical protein